MKHILLFSTSIDSTNGYGNITHSLVQELSPQYQITLLTPPHKHPPSLSKNIRHMQTLPTPLFSFRQIHLLKYLNWYPPEGSYDVIHSLFAFPYAILAHRFASSHHLPLIIGAQGTYGVQPLTTFPEKWFLTRAYNYARAIHTPSLFTKNQITHYSHTQTPITVIPNGIKLAEFNPKPNLSPLKKLYPQGPIIVGIGALKKRKGYHIAIRALVKVREKFPRVKYLIAGEGSSRSELEQLISKLKLEQNVFLLGHKPRKEVIKLFHFADLYLHTPIITDWNFEGFGIVYIEAAACGKPVVASRSGGVESAVKHGKTGLLVKESSVNQTAQAVIRILSDKKLYRFFSRQSKLWAKQHNWLVIAQKFSHLYQTLASS